MPLLVYNLIETVLNFIIHYYLMLHFYANNNNHFILNINCFTFLKIAICK